MYIVYDYIGPDMQRTVVHCTEDKAIADFFDNNSPYYVDEFQMVDSEVVLKDEKIKELRNRLKIANDQIKKKDSSIIIQFKKIQELESQLTKEE